MFDEERAKPKPPIHEIGQDLTTLSVAELDARIALLKSEIARLEADKATKGSHRAAADAFFKR
jgi:uncharacterized small protein (DUF1192 family)